MELTDKKINAFTMAWFTRKKNTYISKLFYCLFQVSISFEADLDDQLNSCICCTHLLNGVESFSTPGVHVAWSLKLQLVGH